MSLEGKAAPPFTLAGSDGKTHSLQEYAGKTVVIYFYPKDNTPGCTKEACGFRDMKPHLDQLGVALLGVSKDGMKSHDKFIADFDLPFVLLSDPDASMMKAYGAYGEKTMYGKKAVGVIRSTVVVGPAGAVELARYNLSMEEAQAAVEKAIGGDNVTTTIEGRERYPVNVRYLRDFRSDLGALSRVLVPASGGQRQIPLAQLADIRATSGPAMIRDEDGMLTGYVYVDMAGRDPCLGRGNRRVLHSGGCFAVSTDRYAVVLASVPWNGLCQAASA